ncbi:MAG: hypothetical protein JST19_18200 [Bacteroidetes bacterium]|nr:hypothetical protein [Bacteroidota bacterium]
MPDQLPFIVYLKNVLEENFFCSQHNAKPVVSLAENAMSIKCCCEQAQAECVQLARDLAEVLGLTDLTIS